MATREIERGPVSDHVSRNLAALRVYRRLTLSELSGKLAELGRPIQTSGLSKIEKGARRVDVDDLVALALALKVSPTRLLLPPAADEETDPVDLTSTRSAPWRRAWQWADGHKGLDVGDAKTTGGAEADAEYEFASLSRPHDPPVMLTTSEVEETAEDLAELRHHWLAALDRGLSAQWLTNYLRVTSLINKRPSGGRLFFGAEQGGDRG